MNTGYTLTDPANASDAQKQIFERARNQFGAVPNIINAFSGAPVLADAMLDLYGRIGQTTLSGTENHVVMQTINVLNRCTYCVPAHSTSARKQGVPEDLDDALRANQSLDDPKLEALRVFTTVMIERRGHIDDAQLEALLDAGYTRAHALEVVFLITVKTLTNYGNHLTGTDLDAPFAELAWSPQRPVEAANA